MSYQVLARKWRPQNFRDMAGQTHVLQALVNALDHNRLHHAYLFTGTRGVGKTTIARILAKCLNCETGVSSRPCEQCSACREITEGRFVDLIEIDAASHTGVDDVRDLIDNSQYLPTLGRYKVYLIDEVHMLSKNAFNALLKTLEEPPAHVKFLLATTDPHKLPVTVLSRCLQFNLKNLTPEKIAEYLNSILEKEMIPFDQAALWLLARAADGSMRDALSLTDQAIAFGGEKVAEQTVREMLGTMDRRLIHPILDALMAGDVKAMLTAVAQLAEQNPDYSGALDELLSLLHRIAIVQAAPEVLDQTPDERERLIQLASSMTAEDVQLYYQIGLNSQRDLPFAPDMRAGFEMTLLRMLAFKPQGVIDSGEKKKTELINPAISSGSASKALADTNNPVKTPTNAASAPVQSTAAISAHVAISAPVAIPPPTAAINNVDRSELHSASAVAPLATPSTIADKTLSTENWLALWQRLPLAGVIRNTAAHCCLDRIDGNCYHFTLDQEQTGLFDDSHATRLGETLSAFLDKSCSVFIKPGNPSTVTPHQLQILKREKLQSEAEAAFKTDPNVIGLLQQFEGEIIADSITPFQKSIH